MIGGPFYTFVLIISGRVACRSGQMAVYLLVLTGIYHGYYPMTYCSVTVHEKYFICSHLGIKWYLLQTYVHQWTVIGPLLHKLQTLSLTFVRE